MAQEDYEYYCYRVNRGVWKRSKHSKLICDTLQRVEAGELDRVMIFLPPRHSKSMTVSEGFPSWFIGKDPERRVIEVSYGDSLAQKFGYANRRKVEEYGKVLFDIETDSSNSSKTNWGIAGHRGGMISAGIGGSITGEGADLLIIDDPVKNRQEADSPVYREMVWDEWQNTLLTRLHPGARVIIIMTRWHSDDLAGRLLNNEGRVEDGGKWTVISLPAIAEEAEQDAEGKWITYPDQLGRSPGEALWPEHGYDVEWAARKKLEVGSYTWASLYQQRPRPRDEMKMFRREWFEIVDSYPRDAKSVRYWDFAATEPKRGKDPDYTAGAKVCEKNGVYWITDMRRTRATPLGVEQLVVQTADIDTYSLPIWIEQEPGSSGVNTIDHYRREVLKGYPCYGNKVTGSKELRALPMSAAAEAGNVKVVRGPWNKAFLDELETFGDPSEHDDQVDAASGGFQKVALSIPTELAPFALEHTSKWR